MNIGIVFARSDAAVTKSFTPVRIWYLAKSAQFSIISTGTYIRTPESTVLDWTSRLTY